MENKVLDFDEYSHRQKIWNKFNEKINGCIHSSFDDYIVEGIVVDRVKRTVKLNDTDEGVVFLENEYLVYKYRNLKVYSILKRTPYIDDRNKNVDGNPFTYALKGKYGWKFDISDAEIIKYVKKFLSACNMLDVQYDVIVMCPTHSGINERFMKVVLKRVNAKTLINDYFCKTETDYIQEFCIDHDKIEKDCKGDKMEMYEIEKKIDTALNNMGKYFESGKMDKTYIKYINHIVSLTNKYTESEAYELFNGKRVLVLDDTLSTGSTVSECVKVIQQYEPTVVDVITLLSKKYKK